MSNGDFDVTEDMLNTELSLTYEGGQAYKIPQGDYTLTVNLETMKLVIAPVGEETREISGNVCDADGNPIEGVTVTANLVEETPAGMRRIEAPYTTTTDANGHYDLTVPAEGEYTLTFEKEGYETITVPEVEAEAVTMELEITAVNDINAAKAVTSVKYYNAAGVASSTAFKGVNVVVTRYADGTKTVTKVVK